MENTTWYSDARMQEIVVYEGQLLDRFDWEVSLRNDDSWALYNLGVSWVLVFPLFPWLLGRVSIERKRCNNLLPTTL